MLLNFIDGFYKLAKLNWRVVYQIVMPCCCVALSVRLIRFILAFRGDEVCWTGVKKLSDVVAKKSPGRTSDTEVTLFKSNGIASWDLAVAMKVYALAKEKGLGRELPFWGAGASSQTS